MEYVKFILGGSDKKTLSSIKNILSSNGHVFVGYTAETYNVTRLIRNCIPSLAVIYIKDNFRELKPVLEVIDEEILLACILVLESRDEEVLDFVRRAKAMSYLIKPVFDEVLLQIADLTLMNFERVLEYEGKVRKLNETLESRKAVEKGKWILVEKDGITESEAYENIRKKSRDNRKPMKEIADAIILTSGL